MKAGAQSDFFQSFGKTPKKSSEDFFVVHHEDSPEQGSCYSYIVLNSSDFHPPSSRRHKESLGSSIRSHSEDKKWAGGTFGKERGRIFENYGIFDEDVSNRNLDTSKNRSEIKEDLNNISRRILEKSRDKSIETRELRETAKFQRECIYREISNYGLKRYLEEQEQRKKLQKFKIRNEKTKKKSSKKNGLDSEKDTKRSEETKEFYINSNGSHYNTNHEKVWPNFRLSFEKIPTINITSIQGSSNRERRSSAEQESSELEQAITKLKEGQDSLKKGKRIKELERQVEELLGSVEIYSSQLAGYIEILRKDLLENNLYVLDLKDDVYALLGHNNKIIELVQNNPTFQIGNLSLELGQEIERSRSISAKVEADLENIVDVVKVNEECATRLAEFTAEKLTDMNYMNKVIVEGRGSYVQKDVQSSHGSLGRMIKEIGNNQNQESVKDIERDRRSEDEEVERLKEELKEFTRIIEMKDKLIKRQNKRIKEMEEFVMNSTKVENGQNTQNIGLKNTAIKIIELQKKIEKGESEKEMLEGQIRKLLKGKEELQKSLDEIYENNEQLRKMENELRETKLELRKMWDKNDTLKELHTKNETLIATLHSLNSELKTEKQALLKRIKTLEDKEVKLLQNHNKPHEIDYYTADILGKDERNEDLLTGNSPMGHQKYSFGNHLDDLFNKKLSSIPNDASNSQNFDLLGQEKKSWIETKSIEKAPDSNVKSDSQSIGPWLKWNGEHLAQSGTISNTVSLPYIPDSELLTNKILNENKKDTFTILNQNDTPRYGDLLHKQP